MKTKKDTRLYDAYNIYWYNLDVFNAGVNAPDGLERLVALANDC